MVWYSSRLAKVSKKVLLVLLTMDRITIKRFHGYLTVVEPSAFMIDFKSERS